VAQGANEIGLFIRNGTAGFLRDPQKLQEANWVEFFFHGEATLQVTARDGGTNWRVGALVL